MQIRKNGHIADPLFKGVALILGVLFMSAFCTAIHAQKTDTIILSDGSKIVGEITSMKYNIMQFKTTGMKTVDIKWYTVRHIIAPNKRFTIEVKHGKLKTETVYGTIDSTSNPGFLRIGSAYDTADYHISQISSIQQIKQRIWGRFSGNLALGLSYTKQTDLWELTYSGSLTYSAPKFLSTLNTSSIRTVQDTIFTRKEDLTINNFVLIQDRYYAVNYLGYNSNTQLGIERRFFIGAGAARNTISTEHIKLLTSIGVIANAERSTETNELTRNYEGTVQLDFRTFKYTSPEIHSTVIARYFPSFTIAGRHRVETEVEVSYEILNNLYFTLSGYFNYDSKPQEGAASTSDFGFNTKLTYKFGL